MPPDGPRRCSSFAQMRRGRAFAREHAHYIRAAIWHGRIVSESTLTSRINAVRKAVG
jgi:DNA-binding winged helix-turn-helix (wHTH) protein